MFGSRDYGVWDKEYPKNSNDRQEKMWLWLNKSTSGPNAGRIDLENFQGRGEKEDKLKGKVLYTSSVTEKPNFDMFQRVPHSSFERFMGIYDSGYESSDDSYYVNHPTHRNKRDTHGTPVGYHRLPYSLSY